MALSPDTSKVWPDVNEHSWLATQAVMFAISSNLQNLSIGMSAFFLQYSQVSFHEIAQALRMMFEGWSSRERLLARPIAPAFAAL